MNIQKVLSEALNARMSRRQFLVYVGALALALIGYTTFMHNLHNARQNLVMPARGITDNIDATPYGGHI